MQQRILALLSVLVAAWATASGAVRAADTAPYDPLRLYDGAWSVSSSDGKHMSVENRCARTGVFFSCEQAVDGKTADLVVFLPREKTGVGQTYRTTALTADGGGDHSWHNLVIDGDRWTYLGDEATPGAGPRDRTLNQFNGPDRIHFEVQVSADGKTWSTTLSGDETRVPRGQQAPGA